MFRRRRRKKRGGAKKSRRRRGKKEIGNANRKLLICIATHSARACPPLADQSSGGGLQNKF